MGSSRVVAVDEGVDVEYVRDVFSVRPSEPQAMVFSAGAFLKPSYIRVLPASMWSELFARSKS